ncbi:LysR substrate-binding domain-containing protein [Limnohabitans sp.]|uniref:LysR substrate-binding domain-containing protein n=1 Tax=Limnohabitans sp. TaxID=1907725 RepID=UPI0025C56319|nr:LysR substrate-binding domain-containing protein [Limnohabitans sp.]
MTSEKVSDASSGLHRLPLSSLRAYEATARLGTMSAAATELFVTHGAISRHIHSLEEQFGVPLLVRHARSVSPTPEGAALASKLTEAFRLMREAIAHLEPGPVTLSCSATIMTKWLIPRLGAFKRTYPDTELRLNINHDEVDFIQDQISLAIRSSMKRPPQGVVIEPLLHEQIGPVCHRDYQSHVGISTIESLAQARILETATRPNAWKEWMTLMNCEDIRLTPHERYEHFYLVIEAAVSQLGVALVPRYLVEKEIESGQLVAPFGFIDSPYSLDLWIAPHERFRDDVRKLADWIRKEMLN